MRNLLVAQSGGPTAAINATVAGVVSCAVLSGKVDHIYGAVNGIEGVLAEKFLDLGQKLDSAEKISLLMQTPAAALGSCRYKLGDPEENKEDFEEILQIFRRHEIRYFIYIGGNDSMDTVDKMSKYCKENGVDDVFVVGAPKTIDNDLVETDHCPGFASAAKYIATSVMEVARDCRVYNKGMITIIECMGRHAGWLTAATVLPAAKGDGPDLIYLPEVDFDMADFLDDVIRVYEGQGQCLVAVSEGIHYSDGAFVSEAKTSSTDGFGHAQLGGLAHRLAGIVSAATGAKVRGIELSLLQRCAAHCASATDIEEAFQCGKVAVESALRGETGKMVGMVCKRDGGYSVSYELFDLRRVANAEKKIPLEWITSDNAYVTDAFIDYCTPLLEGQTALGYEDGLPRFARLKKVFAK
mgnify:CR=1 FL=1